MAAFQLHPANIRHGQKEKKAQMKGLDCMNHIAHIPNAGARLHESHPDATIQYHLEQGRQWRACEHRPIDKKCRQIRRNPTLEETR